MKDNTEITTGIKEDDGTRSKVFTAVEMLRQHYADMNDFENVESFEEKDKRIAEDVMRRIANGEVPNGMSMLSVGYRDSIAKSEERKATRRARIAKSQE